MINKLRLKFWYWAHEAAEDLWHWIYYHRIPEGIGQRQNAFRLMNEAYHSFTVHYVNSCGKEVSEPMPTHDSRRQ